ncbi:MAG: PASTA domain-containing protein, partial [Bacteroidales bacterium]|nr:PASTA domain-containing protein [Bacteroidales bacterium]
MFLTVIGTIAFMFIVCLIVFFATVRGSEQVLVPNVVGKHWSEAFVEMQQKELYAKVQLRYTDSDDEGMILNQTPIGGSITKAGSRVTLTISRGAIVSHVENYVGQNIDDVRMNLQTMFSGIKPLIILDSPSYKSDASPAGTILAQNPPEGTAISSPITVKFIVSRGAEAEMAKVPNYVGVSVDTFLKRMGNAKLVFDFSSHVAGKNEKAAIITRQETPADQMVKNYSRVTLDVALPENELNGKVYGIYQTSLPNYPTPVPILVEIVRNEKLVDAVSFNHMGGSFSIPYGV